MPFQSLRGFRDYPPPEAGARSEILRRVRAVARRCGFTELETPSVESLELFQVKSGDAIAEELWAFQDKGQRNVTLVAETTPSLARVFVDRAKSEPLPVKWFTIGKLWRYEEPQAGRQREFLQVNLDILGVPGIEAEAELLAAACLVLDEAGAEGLYTFHVNDREVTEALARHLGADPPALFKALDRYRKLSPADFAQALDGAGVAPAVRETFVGWLAGLGAGVALDRAPEALKGLSTLGVDVAGNPGATRLTRLFELLVRLGVADRIVFDPSLVRGLAYYTSTVFEAFDREGPSRSLFGGGRYDHLVELFGGPPTPAVGLAIGDVTLELLLKAHGRWPEGEPPLDTYVIAVTPAEVPLVLEWVQKLRRSGVSADGDLMGRSLSRQLKEADRRRARRALILGPKEVARGVVVERDLTTGAQRELAPDAVLPPA